jgi:site-specific DNA-methyltransferase (adenine-specific)
MEIGDKRAVETGKTPADVWTDSRVCGTFGERVKKVKGETAHPCQMPESILRRIISVATEPGDLVVDPFGGSGTTAVAAQKLGRDYWTCELSPVYANVIRERLATPTIFDDDDGNDSDTLARELGIL